MRGVLPFLLVLHLAIDLHGQGLSIAEKKAFNFSYANDVTGQTDQYYTNGVAFSITLPALANLPFSLSRFRWREATTSYHAINFHYDVFTPDLHKDLYSDRPFASVMTIGAKHEYFLARSQLMLTSELQIGIIGQATGAGKLQNGLHKIMPGADRVIGWETQIRNDLAINYIFSLEMQMHRSKYAEIILGGSAYLGSPYTKFEPHIRINVGLMNDYFDKLNVKHSSNCQGYIFGDFKPAYVVYNATLSGGLINPNNPYVLTEIENFVLDLQVGVGITYKDYTFSLGQHFITPEFAGAEFYMWGELNFMITF